MCSQTTLAQTETERVNRNAATSNTHYTGLIPIMVEHIHLSTQSSARSTPPLGLKNDMFESLLALRNVPRPSFLTVDVTVSCKSNSARV